MVDAAALGESGRTVKCVRCGHRWHQTPVEEEAPAVEAAPAVAEAAPEPTPEPEPAAEAESEADVDSEPDAAAVAAAMTEAMETTEAASESGESTPDLAAPAESSSEASAEPPAAPPPPVVAASATGGGRWLWVGWLMLVVFVAGIVGGVVLFREPLVAFWPPASKLYEIVKLPEAPPPPEEFALDIGNVTFERSREGGQPVLLVGGEISNTSEVVQEVPRLRVALSDERGEEIFHWTVTLAASELAAGQQVPFNTRLPNPPANARSLAVTFIVEP